MHRRNASLPRTRHLPRTRQLSPGVGQVARTAALGYAAYLFDLDGTLVDTAPDIHAAANAALSRFGFREIDLALTRRFVGHGGRVLLASALESQGETGVHEDTAERLYRAFLSHYEAHIADLSLPYDGVTETLQNLGAAGVPLAVITNKLEGLSDKLLRELGMRDFFEVLVGLDTLAEHKPHPLPVLHACNLLSTGPGDVLFVGDSATDVATARAAGCDVACVNYGYSGGLRPEELGADQLIASCLELL